MKHFTDPVDAVKAVLGMPREKPLDYPELVHPEPRADEPVVYDHKAEAERLTDLISPEIAYMPVKDIRVSQAAAQVHATLALVEQQRLANLIAWAGVSEIITPARRERIEKGLGL